MRTLFAFATRAKKKLFVCSSGQLRPSTKTLQDEAEWLLMQDRPLDLSQDFGERLMKDMIEKDGTVDPARQHYIIANARKGFFDPHHQQKGKGKNKPPRPLWEHDTNHHLGYLPLNLAGVAMNKNFEPLLVAIAKRAFKSLLERTRDSQHSEHVHVLFFCNQGCHRSVSCCRLMEIVASEWHWEHPACN